MRKSTKAVLLSALVFPGTGHLYLKKHIAGALIACFSLGSLYPIVTDAIERAQDIMAKVVRGEVGLDPTAIAELVARQEVGNNFQLLDLALAGLIVCWVIGIVDSYRCGRALDKSDV